MDLSFSTAMEQAYSIAYEGILAPSETRSVLQPEKVMEVKIKGCCSF